MHMHLISMLLLLLALAGMVGTSCMNIHSIRPYDHGYAVGTAVYVGYARMAEGRSEQFRKQVGDFWDIVNGIQDTDSLASDLEALTGVADAICNSPSLTTADRELAANLKDMILARIDRELGARTLEHEDAVQFLAGVRAGVNAMADFGKRTK